MEKKYVIALDQGTTSSRAIIFDREERIIGVAQREFTQIYPKAGWVEHDPMEIWASQSAVLTEVLAKTGIKTEEVAAIGITNQRETTVVWDKNTGKPIYNAIVWQCRRTADICDELKTREGLEEYVKSNTGLVVDAYFSGTKIKWILENVPGARERAEQGDLLFGTIDTWLLYKLTKGKNYFTDYTNASRTLFFNIFEMKWDNDILKFFNLNNLNFPTAKPSSSFFGETNFDNILPEKIKICSMIGDSHAAAFGEGCFDPGLAKATLGTGSSILMNIGNKKIKSKNGMVTTICWSTGNRIDYALEGIIVTCGATVNWLKNQINLFSDFKETEKIALSVKDNNGVYLIPAFSGLGAPHWKMDLKASIHGLTFDCKKSHIIRAALESIPYQIKDVISSMEKDSGISLNELKVDGGITSNNFVMQFLSDLLSVKITNIGIEEVSALGAAYLAGLESGLYKTLDELKILSQNKKQIIPDITNSKTVIYYEKWKKIIQGL